MKINMQNKSYHIKIQIISLFHRYHFSFVFFLAAQFIKGILIQSVPFLIFSCISMMMLMILIKINLNKKIKRKMKLMKDFLVASINVLTIASIFFVDFEDKKNNFIILDLILGEILFLRKFNYKSSELLSILIFSLSFVIKFQIDDYKILYCFISISLIMIAIVNEIKTKKNCELCQLSNNDLFFSLNKDFQITSENYNFKRNLKENKFPLKIFVNELLKNEICIKKEYQYQPEAKEIISDILGDVEESKTINFETYLRFLQNRKESFLFCIGKIDVFKNKNEVVYIVKKKKKIMIKIKRDKAFEEALNLGSQTKSYHKTIYYIAHELRNPLNCILNLELIESTGKYSFDALSTEFLQPAIISSKIMLNLVGGLLDFAQIEASTFKLVLSKFNIRSLMEEIITIFKFQTKSRGLILELHVDSDVNEIYSDPNRVKQILINLISNAIKYTKKGKIILKAKKFKFSQIQFTVIDTGLGIEEKNVKKLFQAFSKIQNKEDALLNSQGVGLGLLISNQLASLLNKSEGGISVSSKFMLGSEFSFNIYDMKNEDDDDDGDDYDNDEISVSSRRVSSLSSLPCKLLQTKNEAMIIKKNVKKKSSIFFLNHSIESGLRNEFSHNYKINISSNNCIEFENNKNRKNEMPEISFDNTCNSSIQIKRIDNLLLKTDDETKSAVLSEQIERITSIKTEEKHRSKVKSVTFNENNFLSINKAEQNFMVPQDKIKSRVKEKSVTAVEEISLLKKRVEKIKRMINKGCTCPIALIIDDNDFNILSLKTQLKNFGMSCESALSGEIALQKIHKIQESSCCKYFKYIFLDLEMPEKNGLVIYKEISDCHKSFGFVDSTIILNTGYSKSSEIVKDAMSKGIKNILIKPITQMNLVELIDPISMKYLKK